MHPDIEEILYSEEDLANCVKAMGASLTEKYRDKADEGIVMISVLRGAAIFMADLAREVDLPMEMDYMCVSSYGNSTVSSGHVKILKDLSSSIYGRHVIIAEDILDSGLTLSCLIKELSAREPASIAVATLLRKDTPNQEPIECAEVGFVCPDKFIVGYGLDYAERYRNLPFIGVLKPEVYEK